DDVNALRPGCRAARARVNVDPCSVGLHLDAGAFAVGAGHIPQLEYRRRMLGDRRLLAVARGAQRVWNGRAVGIEHSHVAQIRTRHALIRLVRQGELHNGSPDCFDDCAARVVVHLWRGGQRRRGARQNQRQDAGQAQRRIDRVRKLHASTCCRSRRGGSGARYPVTSNSAPTLRNEAIRAIVPTPERSTRKSFRITTAIKPAPASHAKRQRRRAAIVIAANPSTPQKIDNADCTKLERTMPYTVMGAPQLWCNERSNAAFSQTNARAAAHATSALRSADHNVVCCDSFSEVHHSAAATKNKDALTSNGLSNGA